MPGNYSPALGQIRSRSVTRLRCPRVFRQAERGGCADCPKGLLSTRRRRWYPLQCRQMARPRYFEAHSASLRATAPGLVGFHGLAFLRGGMTAAVFRAAIASWHCRGERCLGKLPAAGFRQSSYSRKRSECSLRPTSTAFPHPPNPLKAPLSPHPVTEPPRGRPRPAPPPRRSARQDS